MRVWAVLIYLAVFAGIGTFSLITLAADRLSPAKVTAYTYLTPVWVVIIEMAMGHAIPQPMVLLGGLPIVAALLLLFFETPSADAAARRPKTERH
jgi:drug/metabolite transporter (DMT)-like permease